MKGKIIAIALLILLLCGAMTACSKGGEEEYTSPVYYTVTFRTGEEDSTVRVAAGNTVRKPENPTKDGYLFGGWANGVKLWDFGYDTVTADITLVARWVDAKTVFDYEVDKENETVTITGYHGNISEVTVPNTIDDFAVVAIAPEAFFDTNSEKVTSITLGESIKKVGADAFAECSDVSIFVLGALTEIGERAFLECNLLTEIPLGEGLTEIPSEAFSGCVGLVELVLPESLTLIAENAFDGCTALETVMLSGGVATVEDSAFLHCDALVAIYHRGTPAQWEATDIRMGNNGNRALADAQVYYYAEQKPTDDTVAYWYYNDKGDIRVW